VLFTPVSFINKGQYTVTSKVSAKPEVQKMVTMTPYQADASGRQPKLEAPKAEAKVEASVAEPTKRETKKPEPTPTTKKDLDSVVKAWTDEE
jgi:Holliday junction resolvase RusA-like endonuclease